MSDIVATNDLAAPGTDAGWNKSNHYFIKPLDWKHDKVHKWWYANTGIGFYVIWESHGSYGQYPCHLHFDMDFNRRIGLGPFDAIDKAKDGAWRHWIELVEKLLEVI